VNGHLADTSIFVALEQRRSVGDPPPGPARISVATVTELAVGVRRSTDPAIRRQRQATLDDARRLIPLPFGEREGERLAELIAALLDQRRRVNHMDAIIAATALANDLTIWTQDDDFDVLAEIASDLRVHRG
jgi:predicted nucleic acid-binding protein